MRILPTNHPGDQRGFSYDERRAWRIVIFSNIVLVIRQVVKAMEDLGIELEQDANPVCR